MPDITNARPKFLKRREFCFGAVRARDDPGVSCLLDYFFAAGL
jgi:hypothetical protein